MSNPASRQSNPWTTPSKKYKAAAVATKGLFLHGIWHCNCTPRLPASNFQVRKQGPNKNRWFYTCQEPKEKGCGFFLWDTDATTREAHAVLANTRSEDAGQGGGERLMDSKRGKRGGAGGRVGGHDVLTLEGHAAASNQWLADLGRQRERDVLSRDESDEEGEFGRWDLSVEDERFLSLLDPTTATTYSPSTIQTSPPETPRKTSRFDTTITTPNNKRKRQDQTWPTSRDTAESDMDMFSTPSTSPTSGSHHHATIVSSNPTSQTHHLLLTPSKTPTPLRFHNAISTNPEQQEQSLSPTTHSHPHQPPPTPTKIKDRNPTPTQEILSLLSSDKANPPLPTETTTRIREILERSALRTAGIERGRDVSRLALRDKDRRIAELQARILVLEGEREMDRGVIWGLRRRGREGEGRDEGAR